MIDFQVFYNLYVLLQYYTGFTHSTPFAVRLF